jgi:hypothetical protein
VGGIEPYGSASRPDKRQLHDLQVVL